MPTAAAKPSDPTLRAQPAAARDAMGDAASPTALGKLEGAISELKALTVAQLLKKAIEALRLEDARAGTDWALKALHHDERSGMAWYILAVAREKAGDFVQSIKAYESALALLPEQSDVANDLGRLAFRMGMKDLAEQLFRRYVEAHPTAWHAMGNLATAIRDQGRAEEAIEILRAAIKGDPTDPTLWNTLGTVVSEQSDHPTALIFFDEALRLSPDFAQARYNRGNTLLEMGETEDALADCEAALEVARGEADRAMMQLARATIKLVLGRLGEGWDDYEARLDPQFAGATVFIADERPRWTPDADLAGKTLLVMGEQGLGDEVLFANMLPDVIEALGPEGKLVLALEQRLTPLFQRSFPTAEVAPHLTFMQHGRNFRAAPALGDFSRFDLWVPMASLLRRFRRRVEDFPDRERFLAPDPARVAHWRAALAEAAGRKVGILWKSMKIESARARYYSPFELWAPVLKTPGVTFVNVQYGDCAAEIEWARRELGVEIWTPPGIDLKQDLDDIAALTSALDLTLGFMNATSNIAAACGAPTWIISVPGAWTRLGAPAMPWYPQARLFSPPTLASWEATMAEVAAALAAL